MEHLHQPAEGYNWKRNAIALAEALDVDAKTFRAICKDADTWEQVYDELSELDLGKMERQAMRSHPGSVDPINY